jgi:hypothetical protein
MSLTIKESLIHNHIETTDDYHTFIFNEKIDNENEDIISITNLETNFNWKNELKIILHLALFNFISAFCSDISPLMGLQVVGTHTKNNVQNQSIHAFILRMEESFLNVVFAHTKCCFILNKYFFDILSKFW